MIVAAIAALYLASLPGFAATDQWTNSDNLWSTPSNWPSDQPRDSILSYTLISNANTKTVAIDATTLATNLTIEKLVISAPAGFTNTVALVNRDTKQPPQLLTGISADGAAMR